MEGPASCSKATILAIILLAAVSQTVLAQPFDYNEIGIDALVEPQQVLQGGRAFIVVVLDVPMGYTLTDSSATFAMEPGEIEGFRYGQLEKPEHDHVDEAGGHWGGFIEFRIPLDVSDTARPGKREIEIKLKLQACDDLSGLCYRPTPMNTSAVVEVIAAKSETPAEESATPTTEPDVVEAGNDSAESDQGESVQTVESEPKEMEISGEEAPTAAAVSDQSLDESLKNLLEGALSGGQLWMAILIALIAGVLTSLTPCVYPMIPITIAYVSGRAEGKKMNGFLISLALVLGIVITYTTLGVFAALAGATFGSIGQNLWVQAIVFIVLVVMGFSMLGAFEIGMPASVQQKLQVQRKGYFGALLVGLTIGLVAAPCVAPVLIPILTLIATSGDVVMGVTLMAVYAIGMGLLFILVGTFSNLVLPKSGQWMIELKKVFAFILFLVAVFFGRGLIELIPIPYVFEIVLGALLVLFGTVIGAFHRLEREDGWWPLLGKASGLLLFTAGLIYFSYGLIAYGFVAPMLPAFSTGTTANSAKLEPTWIYDMDGGLKAAEEQGKPVVIDFWADWCAACLELDEYTWSDPRVLAELKRFTTIKIDGSDESDPAYQKARSLYGVQDLPRIVIRNSSGEIAKIFDGFRDADTVLGYLRAVQ